MPCTDVQGISSAQQLYPANILVLTTFAYKIFSLTKWVIS